MHQHDASQWQEHFTPLLEHYDFHLAEHFRSNYVPLYWIMRSEGAILEVGCGSARGAILAKRLNPNRRVVAVDIDENVCKIAAKYAELAQAEIEVQQADMFKLPFKDNEFGVAFSSGLLEHYENEEIIRSLHEQLRVAEYVLVDVPTNLYYIQRGGLDYGDERQVSKSEWLYVFANSGQIVEVSFVGKPPEETGMTVLLTKR